MNEVPYQLSVSQLEDALTHILKMAEGSYSQTRRMKRIAMRARRALNGEEYSQQEATKLTRPPRSAADYETELRYLRREIAELKGERTDG